MKELVVASFFAASAVSFSQEEASPYRGQETREIKALSSDEVRSYRAGEGMGLAKAAELNGYPGPKHVLELAAHLDLSESQRAQVQSAFDTMRTKATTLGAAIVERERELDGLFARQEIDQKGLEELGYEIARLQGELRVAHLEAHLKVKSVLTDSQIAQYVQLRGYHSGSEHHRHQ